MNAQFVNGLKIEKLFAHVAQKNNWNVFPVSEKRNMHDHVDYELEYNGTRFTVDVKAQKKEQRYAATQDDWHVIEFVGVVFPALNKIQFSKELFNPLLPDFTLGSGRPGWLYGKADAIAFELQHTFLLIRRTKLIEFCAASVNFSHPVHSAREAKYKVFSRPDRGDLITYINKKDLYHLAKTRWYKPIVLN